MFTVRFIEKAKHKTVLGTVIIAGYSLYKGSIECNNNSVQINMQGEQ